jgi:plasmid stabilization system protein ParE
MTARFSRRSLAQLDAILEYLTAENPRVATSFSERVHSLASLIDRQPLIGRPTDLERVRVFRASPYPYLLFYSVDPGGSGITILRIRHTARKEDWRKGR